MIHGRGGAVVDHEHSVKLASPTFILLKPYMYTGSSIPAPVHLLSVTYMYTGSVPLPTGTLGLIQGLLNWHRCAVPKRTQRHCYD